MDKRILIFVATIVILYLLYLYTKKTESFEVSPNAVATTPSADDAPVPVDTSKTTSPIIPQPDIGAPKSDELNLKPAEIKTQLDSYCQDSYGNGSSSKENGMNEFGCMCPKLTDDISSVRFCGLLPLDKQLHAMRMMSYNNVYDTTE